MTLFAAPEKDTILRALFPDSHDGAALARSREAEVSGTHHVPGDKSITHRALMFAALAPGKSALRGALTSDDARSTARVLRQLGATISPLRGNAAVTVQGRRRFTQPGATLDCGNSGTTARLLLGILAGQRVRATLTGDASLRRRPMRRVTEPLAVMGARITPTDAERLPLTIAGGALMPLDWRLHVASAQLKSALLLAGAVGGVAVRLHEPGGTRDHTERMLRHFGYHIEERIGGIVFEPTGTITPFEMAIPGDPSSALFLLAAAALADRGSITVDNVGLNPSRTGFLGILDRFGVLIAVSPGDTALGELRGSISAAASDLRATDITAHEVPGVIDEIPILACLAARARGTSRFYGLAELRVKESDRLALLATNLRAIGVSASVDGDDLTVQGTDRPLGGRVITGHDHRIAMAFAVLGTQRGSRITVDHPACASVSFPGFADALASLFTRRR